MSPAGRAGSARAAVCNDRSTHRKSEGGRMTVAPQRTRPVPGTGHGLISPHGGALVDRTGERPDNLERLEVVTLTSRELSDLDMLAAGALSPLEGFMSRADYERVVEEMRLASGLPWALPVCLVGVLDVEETYE